MFSLAPAHLVMKESIECLGFRVWGLGFGLAPAHMVMKESIECLRMLSKMSFRHSTRCSSIKSGTIFKILSSSTKFPLSSAYVNNDAWA